MPIYLDPISYINSKAMHMSAGFSFAEKRAMVSSGLKRVNRSVKGGVLKITQAADTKRGSLKHTIVELIVKTNNGRKKVAQFTKAILKNSEATEKFIAERSEKAQEIVKLIELA